MSTRAKRAAGLLPMYERQASKYYDKHEESGLHENIKDGYIGSTSKLDGMGELVDTLHNEDGGFYGEDNGEKTYIYKKAKQTRSTCSTSRSCCLNLKLLLNQSKTKDLSSTHLK